MASDKELLRDAPVSQKVALSRWAGFSRVRVIMVQTGSYGTNGARIHGITLDKSELQFLLQELDTEHASMVRQSLGHRPDPFQRPLAT